MAITNKDLYLQTQKLSDTFFVVTEKPIIQENSVIININLNENVAVSDKYTKKFLNRYHTVSEIRTGKNDLWLLSGGVVVFDDYNRIAVGLRDENGTDPFLLTNIGDGLCDRSFLEHCLQELGTELLVFAKIDDGFHHQITFGQYKKSPTQLNKMNVKTKAIKILNNLSSKGIAAQETFLTNHKVQKTIHVKWDCNNVETLKGYVLIDYNHHTTEFRVPKKYKFAQYKELEVFFGEGTGYGSFMHVDKIYSLISVADDWGIEIAVPFLKYIVGILKERGSRGY